MISNVEWKGDNLWITYYPGSFLLNASVVGMIKNFNAFNISNQYKFNDDGSVSLNISAYSREFSKRFPEKFPKKEEKEDKRKFAELINALINASLIGNKGVEFPNFLQTRGVCSVANYKKAIGLIFSKKNSITLKRPCAICGGSNYFKNYDVWTKKRRFLNFMLNSKLFDPLLNGDKGQLFLSWDWKDQDKRFPICDVCGMLLLLHFFRGFANKRYFINSFTSFEEMYESNKRLEQNISIEDKKISTHLSTILLSLSQMASAKNRGVEIFELYGGKIRSFVISPLVIEILSNEKIIHYLNKAPKIILDYILAEDFYSIALFVYEQIRALANGEKNLYLLVSQIYSCLIDVFFGDSMGGKIYINQWRESLKKMPEIKETLEKSKFNLIEAARTENWELLHYIVTRAFVVNNLPLDKTFSLFLSSLPPTNENAKESIKLSTYNLVASLSGIKEKEEKNVS
jgi:hypothetical protein